MRAQKTADEKSDRPHNDDIESLDEEYAFSLIDEIVQTFGENPFARFELNTGDSKRQAHLKEIVAELLENDNFGILNVHKNYIDLHLSTLLSIDDETLFAQNTLNENDVLTILAMIIRRNIDEATDNFFVETQPFDVLQTIINDPFPGATVEDQGNQIVIRMKGLNWNALGLLGMVYGRELPNVSATLSGDHKAATVRIK